MKTKTPKKPLTMRRLYELAAQKMETSRLSTYSGACWAISRIGGRSANRPLKVLAQGGLHDMFQYDAVRSEIRVSRAWWGANFSLDEKEVRNCRTLMLCFMAAMQ